MPLAFDQLRQYPTHRVLGAVCFDSEGSIVSWDGQDRPFTQCLPQVVKGLLLFGSPPPRLLAGQLVQRSGDLAEVPDEAPVEVDEVQELLDTPLVARGLPLSVDDDLGRVSPDLPFLNNDT